MSIVVASPPKDLKRHNHYSRRDFFTFNSQEGTIIDWNGSQNLLVSEDFIVGLQKGLEEEVGDASAAVMYSMGMDWGARDAVVFGEWFEKEFNMKPTQANVLFLLETWWWPFTAQGWGKWEVDMDQRKQGFIFINLFDSAVAKTLGDVGKPVCHLYAGLFSGFFTSMVSRSLSCIEVQCYAMGETYCKFLIASQQRIDAASFWLNEGASAKEISRRLESGERR
jgi:predicted hydrocarbon binding protein